jgi:uncharacterized protein (TIGR03382 family)
MKAGIVAALILGSATAAHAQTATFAGHDGNNAGRLWNGDPSNNNQRGAGIEHLAAVQMAQAQKLLVFGTASYTDIANAADVNIAGTRIQGLCTAYDLSPTAGLTMSAQRYFTDNDGDEYQNAHKMCAVSLFGGTHALAGYGYDPDNNTDFWVTAVDGACNEASAQTRILQKNNDNIGGCEMMLVRETADTAEIAYTVIGNGNGTDDAWSGLIRVTKNGAQLTATPVYDFSHEANEERSRTVMAPTAIADHVFQCWAAGNTQPPNRGLRCGLVNTAAGVPNGDRLVWRQYIMERNGDFRYSTPAIAPILDAQGAPTNEIMVSYVEVDNGDRNGRRKGPTNFYITKVRVTTGGLETVMAPRMIAPNGGGAHHSMCGVPWGPAGDPAQVLIEGSITDSGPGIASVFRPNSAGQVVKSTEVSFSEMLGGGWTAQYYGNNPNTPQGRQYNQCFAMANPGYGAAGGFMPEVKELLVVPTARRMRELDGTLQDKNGFDMVLVASVVPNVADPDDPDDVPPPAEETPAPQDEETPAPQDDSNDGTPAPQGGNSGGEIGSGCSAAGSGSSLMLLLLAAFLVTRRRNPLTRSL